MFNVGDKVIITSGRYRFSKYEEWIWRNAPEYINAFNDLDNLSTGDMGTIVAVAHHGYQERNIYLVSDGYSVALISGQGIERVVKETNVKQYKSWEVMKELTEHPNKKFSPVGDPQSIIQIGRDGYIVGSLGNQSLSIYDMWVDANTQVDFMEAFTAFRENRKDIYCIYGGEVHEFSSDSVGECNFNEELIDYGEWYIK